MCVQDVGGMAEAKQALLEVRCGAAMGHLPLLAIITFVQTKCALCL
jgi:hypothetical protein